MCRIGLVPCLVEGCWWQAFARRQQTLAWGWCHSGGDETELLVSMRTLSGRKLQVRLVFAIDVMMYNAPKLCLFTMQPFSVALAGVGQLHLHLPVSALAAPNFLAELRIHDDSTRQTDVHAPAYGLVTRSIRRHIPSPSCRDQRTLLQWSPSHKAPPCSRSPIDLCPRSPRFASVVRISQRPTLAWVPCHQSWVRVSPRAGRRKS